MGIYTSSNIQVFKHSNKTCAVMPPTALTKHAQTQKNLNCTALSCWALTRHSKPPCAASTRYETRQPSHFKAQQVTDKETQTLIPTQRIQSQRHQVTEPAKS